MSKKKTNDLSLKEVQRLGAKVAVILSRYSTILFFLLITSVYGFVVLRVNTLVNAQPSQSDIDAQSRTSSVPRVDPSVAEQLQKLQDNSVNVQTLFNQARNNPFQ